MSVEVICRCCNSVFLSPIRKGVVQKYCSMPCYRESSRGPRPDLVKLTPVVCPQCQKEFQPKDASKRFCSRPCAASYRFNPSERGLGPTRTTRCVVCDAPFQRKRVANIFCSQECYIKHNVGENNPHFKDFMWNDGRGYLRYSGSHPMYPGRYVHNVNWHNANPDGVCARCGGDVDHIHHRDRNKANNDLNNLMGLCASCHRQLHAEEDRAGLSIQCQPAT